MDMRGLSRSAMWLDAAVDYSGVEAGSSILTKRQESEYGLRIRSERVRLGYTQAKWAERCGVSKTSQVHYESGTYRPDVAYLSGAVSAGADPLYILEGRSTAANAAAVLDWGLAAEIISIVDAWAAKKSHPISAATRAQLLKVFYSQFSASGKVDERDVMKSLALVG